MTASPIDRTAVEHRPAPAVPPCSPDLPSAGEQGTPKLPAGVPPAAPAGPATSPSPVGGVALSGPPDPSPPGLGGPDLKTSPSRVQPPRARDGGQAPPGRVSGEGARPGGFHLRTWTIDDCVRVYARHGRMAHLQPPDAENPRAVLCNRIPPWEGGWRGVASDAERERGAALPICRQCISVLETKKRGGKAQKRSTAPRKPRPLPDQALAELSAAPARRVSRNLREPGLTIIPGPRPFLSEVGDEAAAFVLRREVWDLPAIARFTIDGEPVSKARARFTQRGSKTRAYTPDKTLHAEQIVGWKFRQAAPGHKLDRKATYGVIALFFCGSRQRRDVDNMLKLILDGLNQVAWPDDEQVTEVSARKTLTLPENARTEVAVYGIGEVQRFTEHCEYCGQEFAIYPCWQSAERRRRYCSQDCANAARRTGPRMRATCEGCGQVFAANPNLRKYCSSECRNANGRMTVACTGCGVEFTKQKCHVRAKNYCTDKCRDAANRDHRQRLAKGTCETCGGATSKKSYRQCNACFRLGTNVTGKPGAVVA